MTGRICIDNQSNRRCRCDKAGTDMNFENRRNNYGVYTKKTGKYNQRNTKKSFFSKRKMIILALLFVLILFAGFGPLSSVFQSESSVVEANHQLTEMRYKVVQIEEGDSLWNIAKNNMNPGFSDIHEYIYEIKRCNQLDSDIITTGNYLMIPYYEDLSSTIASIE